jgi:hypothetical protein
MLDQELFNILGTSIYNQVEAIIAVKGWYIKY